MRWRPPIRNWDATANGLDASSSTANASKNNCSAQNTVIATPAATIPPTKNNINRQSSMPSLAMFMVLSMMNKERIGRKPRGSVWVYSLKL